MVDDHATSRALTVDLLSRKGHRAFGASAAAEVPDLAARKRPDLVIAHVLTPALDGLEFVRRMRAIPEIAATQVILYTAHYHEREARALARSCGVLRVLVEPSKPADILDAIDEALERLAASELRLAEEVSEQIHLQQAQLRSEAELRRLNADLERGVAERTAELEAANKELEAFDSSISHDRRAPINRIVGLSGIVEDEYGGKLDERGRDLLARIVQAGRSMDQLVGDLFALSTVTRGDLARSPVDVTLLAESVAAMLRKAEPQRAVRFVVAPGMTARADPGLLRIVLENLLGNAWKFTRKRADASVEMGWVESGGGRAFFVRDNGAGFDSANAGRLFSPFRRLHADTDYEGTGIGLATVQRIVRRHGGRVWAQAEVGAGATLFFTLPE